MNYVERHFGDWARDTAHLSMLEDGAYNRLCDLYYVRETALPAELAACCRLVRANTKPERDAVKSVLNEFFVMTAEGWRHKRCDVEIERFRNKSGKASASAKARWSAKPTQSEGNADGMPHAGAGGRAPTPQAPLPSISEANASGADAPPLTARDRVWVLGPPLLGESSRGLLGKLAKSYGEEVLADVLAEATRDKPIDPKAWVTATCIARAKPRVNGHEDESGDEALANPRPAWAIAAGFPDRFQAENAGCTAKNAHKWRNGARLA